MRQTGSVFLTAPTLLLVALSFLASPAGANTAGAKDVPPTAGLSHVRVVRLSFVEGTVTVRRPGSDEWASATVNTPIEEGFSVATGKGSFAEVQFENGSAVRLGELSSVDFTELALTPLGGHVNHVTLDEGYASLRVIPDHYDDYLLNASGVSVTPHGKSEFRTDVNQDRVRVEVFNGEVEAADASQTEKLAKNHALTLDLASGAPFEVSDRIQPDAWDKWAAARDQQSTLAYNDSAVGLRSPLYGWDDLDAFGDWGYFPGFGYGWAPYEPAGWSPYAAGMWSWYPGWGYTWISGEPWGWLPFHYGFWNFNPAMGWFWMPNSFAAWSPALVNWYSGPGWIGWAPVGAAGPGGAAPCTLAAAGCLTAVPPGVLRTGQPIRAGGPHVLPPGSLGPINAIVRPNVAPDRTAMFSGHPAPGGANSLGSAFTRGVDAAPSSVVMGRQVSADAFLGHHSFLGGRFGSASEPIHVRLGGAMGGQPAFAAGILAARGSVPAGTGPRPGTGSTLSRAPQVQVLSHSSVGGSYGGAGGFGARGGGASSGAARSAGGGAAGISSGSAGGGGGAHSGGGAGGHH
jgi:uncharacterized protein DUF6600/FecR-like protein